MNEERSLLRRVVTWTILGVLAVLAIRIAFRVLGAVIGLAAFLVFTVGPLVLVGWLAVKAWKAFRREPAV